MRLQKQDPPKSCEWCGLPLTRKRFSSGTLEDRSKFLKRKFCNPDCHSASQVKDVLQTRGQWRYRKFLKPACERCGYTNKLRLHVHHRDGVIANNNPTNLETICVMCHNRHHHALL